jgi:hypothetical protein
VNNNLFYVDNEEFGDNPVLIEIEKQVAKHNCRIQAQMVKQSQAYGVITKFKDGDIATLLIPSKMRLKTKSKQLLVWILLGDHDQYCYGPVLDRNGRDSTRLFADTYRDTDLALASHVTHRLLKSSSPARALLFLLLLLLLP